MTRKNGIEMKRLRMTLSTYTANRLLKNEKIVLETRDESSKKTREFIVEILEVISDIPRCQGCTCFLRSDDEIHKYKTGIYCDYCFQKRVDKQREITQLSANKKRFK